MIYRDREDDDAVLPEEAVSELLDGDEDEDEKVDVLPEPEEDEKWEGGGKKRPACFRRSPNQYRLQVSITNDRPV